MPISAPVATIRNDYTVTNATTASFSNIGTVNYTTRYAEIYDSSGRTLVIGTGVSGTETAYFYTVPPGGSDGVIPFLIRAKERVSVKALDTTASVGQIIINCFA